MLYKTEDEYYNRFLVSALRDRYFTKQFVNIWRRRLVFIQQGPVCYEDEALRCRLAIELCQNTGYNIIQCMQIVEDVENKREGCKTFPW